MEDSAVAQGEIAGNGESLGFGGRLQNIFINPTKTFEAINIKPTWFWPFLILLIITLASAYLTLPQQMKMAVDNMMKQGDIPPEQLQMAMKFIPVSILAGSVIFLSIWFFITAAVYYMFGSVLLGGDSTFKKVLSLEAWTSLIAILATIINVPLVRAKDSIYVSLSPALLLPSEYIGTKTYAFLSQMNFFAIWYIIVFALGFGYLYKFNRIKSFSIVVIWWVISAVAISFLTQAAA